MVPSVSWVFPAHLGRLIVTGDSTMQFHRTVLRAANSIFNLAVILLLLIAGSYSAFALWDNQRIYAAAGDVQADMIKLKPELVLTKKTY